MKIKNIMLILFILILLTGCKEKTYTITFNTDGGTVMESIKINKGDKIKNLEEPKKEGYLFVNWLKDGHEYDTNLPITEDITLTATWTKKPEISKYYTVNFIIDDKKERTTVKENELVNEPTPPKKENYDFIGWYSGEEKFDFNTKIDKDIILTAKYELNIIKITYDLDGGTGIKETIIKKGETLKIPDKPTKKDYKFLKWTLNDEEFSFDKEITESITLKAIWEPIEYITVIFDTDGGTIIEPIKLEKHTKIEEIETPEKEGYIFKEWQLSEEPFDKDMIIDKDITLKAIYTK